MKKNFNLSKNRYIYLIGGGGKTTLMFFLADYLKKKFKVITTTTTKIYKPKNNRVLIENNIQQLKNKLMRDDCFYDDNMLTIAQSYLEKVKKLSGYEPEILDDIFNNTPIDYMIVEADGSAGKSIKGYKNNEPVLSKKADIVILVIGIDIIGKPFLEENVHRSELYKKKVNIEINEKITINHLIEFFSDKNLFIHTIDCDLGLFISKVKTNQEIILANKLFNELRLVLKKLKYKFFGDLPEK